MGRRLLVQQHRRHVRGEPVAVAVADDQAARHGAPAPHGGVVVVELELVGEVVGRRARAVGKGRDQAVAQADRDRAMADVAGDLAQQDRCLLGH